MTKPRPRRDRTEPEIDEQSWRFLCDAVTDEDRASWLHITLEFDDDILAVAPPPTGKKTSELWAQFGADVLAWWIKENPGTRPWCWWQYSAPELRGRVGGTGTTKREAVGWEVYAPDYGLPDSEDWMMAKDKSWLPYSKCDFHAFDPADPPTYESQAAYLKRLGLFEPGEESRLRRNAFDPVEVFPSLNHHGRGRASRPDLVPMAVPER
jgi:hypothetical protein